MINAIFQQDKHIHCSVLKYEAYVYSVQKLGKDLLNLAFLLVSMPHAHKIYILRHCSNIIHVFNQ